MTLIPSSHVPKPGLCLINCQGILQKKMLDAIDIWSCRNPLVGEKRKQKISIVNLSIVKWNLVSFYSGLFVDLGFVSSGQQERLARSHG